MTGHYLKMTPEWEKEICDDLRSGMPVREILEKHEIGGRRLQKIQIRNGLLRGPAAQKKRDAKIELELAEKRTEDDVFWSEFPRLWDEATRPFRCLIWQREKRRGVYW